MPPVAKRAIIQGTEQTLNVVSPIQFASATIRYIVRDLTLDEPSHLGDTVEDRIQEAIDHVLQFPWVATYVHPEIDGLVLQRVKGRLVGPRKAIVDLFYRTPADTDGGITPTVNAVAHYRTGYENVEVFASGINDMGDPIFDDQSGLPGPPQIVDFNKQLWYNMSDELLRDPLKRPRHWMWPRPVIRFVIRTTLTYNPLLVDLDGVLLVNIINFVNQDQVSLLVTEPPSNPTFEPGSIRFDGADVDQIVIGPGGVIGSGVLYRVDYTFTATSGRFTKQIPRYAQTDGFWHLYQVAQHPAIIFDGRFPIA